MISKETATDIALAYREIETATKLVEDISESLRGREMPDVRDAFGRRPGGLTLGVPSGPASSTCYHVPWPLAKVVLEAHIEAQRQLVSALNAKAAIEAAGGNADHAEVPA